MTQMIPPSATPAEISRRSTRYLKSDTVRPTQARAYLDLFETDRAFLSDLWAQFDNDRADMERAALGHQFRDATAERSQLNPRYEHLRKSHRWLRGIIATALVLDDLAPTMERPQKHAWLRRRKGA